MNIFFSLGFFSDLELLLFSFPVEAQTVEKQTQAKKPAERCLIRRYAPLSARSSLFLPG